MVNISHFGINKIFKIGLISNFIVIIFILYNYYNKIYKTEYLFIDLDEIFYINHNIKLAYLSSIILLWFIILKCLNGVSLFIALTNKYENIDKLEKMNLNTEMYCDEMIGNMKYLLLSIFLDHSILPLGLIKFYFYGNIIYLLYSNLEFFICYIYIYLL